MQKHFSLHQKLETTAYHDTTTYIFDFKFISSDRIYCADNYYLLKVIKVQSTELLLPKNYFITALTAKLQIHLLKIAIDHKGILLSIYVQWLFRWIYEMFYYNVICGAYIKTMYLTSEEESND